MKCTHCDAELVAEAIFCHQCGQRVGETTYSESPLERFSAATTGRDDDDSPENELWQGKYSKLAMIGSWIGAGLFSLGLLLTAAVSGFSGTAWGISLLLILAIWIGLLIQLFYRQLSEHYYLTDRRFIHERGILWREINRIEAIDIDDVSFHQGPIERALGVGTIQIRSSDNSHPELEIHGIEQARVVAEQIDEVRRQERRKRGLHIESV